VADYIFTMIRAPKFERFAEQAVRIFPAAHA
jgi:hypothetical protein